MPPQGDGMEINMAQFTNQAQLSYNGNVVNSNITVGEFLDALTAEKHAVTGTYSVGDSLTYVISIISTSENAQTVTVTDDLGSYIAAGETVYPLAYIAGSVTYYRNGALQPSPTVTSAAPLTVTGITVPAGGSVILIYKANVTEFADPTSDGVITNIATIDGSCVTTPLRVAETVSAAGSPVLTITKSLEPTVISGCGGRVTYTFTIRNHGSAPALPSDNVILTDSFYPLLHGISVTRDGSSFPAAAYTYSESTGYFATERGCVTVPAATFYQDSSGVWTVTPGETTLIVTGTV